MTNVCWDSKTWLQKDKGPGPSGSGFGVLKGDLPPLNLSKCMAEAPEAPNTPFMQSVYPGVSRTGLKLPKNLPILEDHLCAKFRPNLSSGLDFYREQTDPQTHRHCPLKIRVSH